MAENSPANRRPAGFHEHGQAGPPDFSPNELFQEILRLDRKNAPAEEVQFLDYLCFRLNESAARYRFVLWQPVALFLQHGFDVCIEEQLCRGQVVLADLHEAAAQFVMKIVPVVESVRRKNPILMVTSGPQILLHLLPELAENLRWHDQSASEKVQLMYLEFKSAVRRGDYSGLSALRAQLSTLAATASESEVRACIDFLHSAGDARNWPDHATALASERVLARDWLTPEEDAAWSHL